MTVSEGLLKCNNTNMLAAYNALRCERDTVSCMYQAVQRLQYFTFLYFSHLLTVLILFSFTDSSTTCIWGAQCTSPWWTACLLNNADCDYNVTVFTSTTSTSVASWRAIDSCDIKISTVTTKTVNIHYLANIEHALTTDQQKNLLPLFFFFFQKGERLKFLN